MIMTYTAILSLAILRDDFLQLDRTGIVRFIASCQDSDGSFSTTPGAGDSDLRMSYCAFALSSMLDDWSGIDIPRALAFVKQCRILNENELIDTAALRSFVARCQYKYGGIAKAPGEHPDPYHTYLTSAALAINPPGPEDQLWTLQSLDMLLNTTIETSQWMREHVPVREFHRARDHANIVS
ncbi:hypothetical protein EWM64_g10059 [Hericium alpestre]|uniref:Prenyltransferase alpha-alpha toroid domain-containing protein n=1 Tax=Hericium alpestre TaxID=135208 RepID=A0A4Y9ZJ87_9AGAM|nr:hypothetical protein EWM64_g10059 [Hericium alpestre]